MRRVHKNHIFIRLCQVIVIKVYECLLLRCGWASSDMARDYGPVVKKFGLVELA